MKIAIDASRNRSGGAIVHAVNILKHFDPIYYKNINEIHLWSYDSLLNKIPDYPWLVKHSPKALNKNITHQLYWQYYKLPKEIRKNECALLFSLDAGSVCRFSPYITMSRDMLSFEKKEFYRYFFSAAWVRLYLLKLIQLSSFKKSLATIFLTEYAKDVISKYQKIDYETVVINHGISDQFRILKKNKTNLILEEQIVISYVSNSGLYKHNWNVIEAVAMVRKKYNYNIQLQLLGAEEGDRKSLNKTFAAVDKFDSKREFVTLTPRISHPQLVDYLEETDVFLFASTCENMPNTLIEGMSTGLPIITSNYGPMPEIVENAALFFDPENIDTISDAILRVVIDDKLRLDNSKKSSEISKNFSWKKCSKLTFDFLNSKIVNEKN
ncbi:glycosyltransferase [Pseudotenacibaculum sp. MALMAid0570]|uniref:glycosyltransferase n=1 Tax=Pseudotenacibaculum sp. MALMAid0570 TaxID=3143938 RepID=UPI0032DE8679